MSVSEMLRFAAPPRFSKIIVEAASLRGGVRRLCGRSDARRGARHLRAIVGRAKAGGNGGRVSDLTVRLAAFEEATRGGFDRQRVRQLGLSAEVVSAVKKASEQYARLCPGADAAVIPDGIVRRAVLSAFPDRSRAAGSRLAAKRVSGPTVSSSCARVEPRSSPKRAWSERRRGS